MNVNENVIFCLLKFENEVFQHLVVFWRCFFACRAVGRPGTVKMAVPNGRHGTAKRPMGCALGQRPGTSTVQARPDRHGGPLRHDTLPGRHGPMAMYRWKGPEWS